MIGYEYSNFCTLCMQAVTKSGPSSVLAVPADNPKGYLDAEVSTASSCH